jgi:DNA-binding response OmpR family regulator
MTDERMILVVEDDQQWQSILTETLEDEGYRVVTIADYERGRRALQENVFDLVVLDLELDQSAPMFEGKLLLNMISRHYSSTPCIVVSGKGDTQIVRDAFKRYQVVDYITKDYFDIPTFIDAVHTALAPHHLDGPARELAYAQEASESIYLDERSRYTIPEYEHILEIIQNMGQVMERNPQSFAETEEEDLRNHFLVQLNGRYAGNATGETFNYTGKTDILIRARDRNLFIAECKFWKGPKGLLETIDQLLSCANWRDTKTAILLFNRSTTFSYVLSKIPEIAEAHACFKRKIGIERETVFRYIFRRPDDPERELLLTILAFDVPR